MAIKHLTQVLMTLSAVHHCVRGQGSSSGGTTPMPTTSLAPDTATPAPLTTSSTGSGLTTPSPTTVATTSGPNTVTPAPTTSLVASTSGSGVTTPAPTTASSGSGSATTTALLSSGSGSTTPSPTVSASSSTSGAGTPTPTTAATSSSSSGSVTPTPPELGSSTSSSGSSALTPTMSVAPILLSDDGIALSFCTPTNAIMSEYYGHLYIDTIKGNKNEKFTYDLATKLIYSLSGDSCLDVFVDNGNYFLRTTPCSPGSFDQQWNVDFSCNRVHHARYTDKCIAYDASKPGSQVYIAACDENDDTTQWFGSCPKPITVKIRNLSGHYLSEFYTGLFADIERNNQNEIFTYDSSSLMFQVQSNQQCLDAYLDDSGAYQLHTYPCDPYNLNQKWIVISAINQFRHATHNNLCLNDTFQDNHAVTVAPCDTTQESQKWIVSTWSP